MIRHFVMVSFVSSSEISHHCGIVGSEASLPST